jgi:hypothetical protein
MLLRTAESTNEAVDLLPENRPEFLPAWRDCGSGRTDGCPGLRPSPAEREAGSVLRASFRSRHRVRPFDFFLDGTRLADETP